MVSRAQQILVKRAQREAGLSDADYRDVLEMACHCRSTKDLGFNNRAVDLVVAFMEAIHWRKVDQGLLPAPCSADAVFWQRGYWQKRNPKGSTSRDRWNQASLASQISQLEAELGALGFGPEYCAGIRRRVAGAREDD